MIKSIFLGIGILMIQGMVIYSAFTIGRLSGLTSANYSRFVEESESIQPVLDSDPKFEGVRVNFDKLNGAWLSGDIKNKDNLEDLRKALTKSLGQKRVGDWLKNVSIGN